MTDISKCANGCDKQDKCYRWTAPSHEFWQAYMDFKPDENGECKDFWSNEDE